MSDPAPDIEAIPVEWVALDELRPHPRNYRAHPADQIAHIARSIELHGFYRDIVTAADLTILAGHGVALAARRLGLVTVPIKRLAVGPESALALKVLTGDNEMSRLGEVDDRQLCQLLDELAAQDGDADPLLGTGFDREQLAALEFLTRPPAVKGSDEWLGLPEFFGPQPDPTITIYFDSEDERDAFAAGQGWTLYQRGHSRFLHWPEQGHRSTREVQFEVRE